jgi:hypothetical protein
MYNQDVLFFSQVLLLQQLQFYDDHLQRRALVLYQKGPEFS